MNPKISEQFLKKENLLSNDKLSILLKIVELESQIEYNYTILNYISTQLTHDSNVIETILQKKEILESELATIDLIYVNNKK